MTRYFTRRQSLIAGSLGFTGLSLAELSLLRAAQLESSLQAIISQPTMRFTDRLKALTPTPVIGASPAVLVQDIGNTIGSGHR